MPDPSARPRGRDVEALRHSFRGEVITPADPPYDEARRLWNAIHDRRPSVILRPRDARAVAVAVAFARDRDLEIVVRSGGHSIAGLTGRPGGLVVDLSAMRQVEVDVERRVARVDGGTLLGQLDAAAQAHGLVCPVGVVGHTGVAGLTLGGGVGRLQRRFGLTIDNLESVELITADGRFVRASEREEPELFWGMRGAGWNFGIATAFEFRLQPFGPDLHRGIRIYPASQAGDIWAIFRDFVSDAPDAVSVILGLDRAGEGAGYPDDVVGRPIVYVAYNHAGPIDAVEHDTAALRSGPMPLATTTGSQPYLEVQVAHDLVFGWGHRSFLRGCNASGLDDVALEQLVELVATAPADGSFSITALGGAIGRVPEEATAYAGRDAVFDMSADIAWTDPQLDDACVDWARRAVRVVEPFATLGRYSNGTCDVGPEETRAIYGDGKLARLAALKRTWDPDNVFHVNHNVAP